MAVLDRGLSSSEEWNTNSHLSLSVRRITTTMLDSNVFLIVWDKGRAKRKDEEESG